MTRRILVAFPLLLASACGAPTEPPAGPADGIAGPPATHTDDPSTPPAGGDGEESEPVAWTEVGNPTKKISSGLTVRLGGGTSGIRLNDYAGGAYEISAALMGLGALELHLEADSERCDDWWEELRGPVRCKDGEDASGAPVPSGVVELLGPTDVDLLAAGDQPLADVRIPAGRYTHATVKLTAHPLAPAQLGFWARAVGVADSGTRLEAVEPGLRADTTLTADADLAIVEEGGALEVVIDPSAWLREVDLDACSAAGDPPVRDGVMSVWQTADVEPCGACDGGITELTLRWVGRTGATLRMREGGITLHEAVVRTNEEFRLEGHSRTGSLGNLLTIEVDGAEAGRLRTSCGRFEGVGQSVADLIVVGGRSLIGGRFCTPEGDETAETLAAGCAGVTDRVTDAIRTSATLQAR